MTRRTIDRKEFLKTGLVAGSVGLLGFGANTMAESAGSEADNALHLEKLLNNSKEVMGIRNVKGFGAKGDGKTDDTAAILKAMQNLPRSGSNPVGMIFFPPGNYLVNRQKTKDFCIQVGPDHEVILAGTGSGSALITKDEGATILDMNGNLGDNIRRITIRDLHFIGGRCGIRLDYACYDRIINCFFHSQAEWGISLASTTEGTPTSLTLIQGNIFTHTCGITIDGSNTKIGNGAGVQIIGNVIGEDIRSKAAINLIKTRGYGNLNYGQISIVNNTIYEPNYDAVAMEEADLVLVANNRILKPARHGIVVDKSEAIQIHGNLFYGTRQDGITVTQSCQDIQIIGNLFRFGPFKPTTAIQNSGQRTAIFMNDFSNPKYLVDSGKDTRIQFNRY